MNLIKLTSNGCVTIPAPLRKKYGLHPGRKVKLEVDDEGIKIIPLATAGEIQANIGFLRTTSQRPGKKGKLLNALMEEKKRWREQ